MVEITNEREAVEVEQGDRVKVEFDSARGGRKEITGEVVKNDSIDIPEGAAADIHISADSENQRHRDAEADRMVSFMAGGVEVKNKNGSRWQRMSELGGDVEMVVED